MMQEALEGQTLGRYQLQHCIGQGGMAEVYLALDKNLHREIAVKLVHRGRTEDLARFRREVEMLAPLAHEHILPVYDSGQEGPWHYLVMPYISHGTLSDRLDTRGPLTPGEAGILLDQLASALQYAHDHGILHRDIKPSNILLRDDAYAYLTDFGIAKSFTQADSLTQTGSFIGTPEYMAPELFETQATQGSDIYALGVVLYAMLIGKPPFTGPHPLAIAQKQLHEPPIPPSQINPAISPAVEQVLLCALEKDPQRRFQGARAFANAYHNALHAPVLPVARPVNATSGFHAESTMNMQPAISIPPQRSSRAMRARHPYLLIASGLLVLFLLLIGSLVAAFSLSQHMGQPSALSTTRTTTAPVSTPTATQPVTTCTVDDSADVLDQNQICPAGRSPLSYSLIVDTSNNGDGFKSPTPAARTIVITIIVNQSHHEHGHPNQVQVMITGGSAVPLTGEQYHRAQDAFNQAAHSGDDTSATLAAIQSLQASGA